jgi:serpin B
MPRFQTETELPLNDTMAELGMPTAFTMGAEFPYFGNRDVFISQMFQKAKIELDEEGTKAAAVTEIGMAPVDCCTDVAEFHANRPFVYVIQEASSGAIFFIGTFRGE